MTRHDAQVVLILAALTCAVISGLLFVVFGQVTVRRLRKDPSARSRLGIALISGWDILNVAAAVSCPRVLSRRLERGPLGYLYADSDWILSQASRVERALGRAQYWTHWMAVLLTLACFAVAGWR